MRTPSLALVFASLAACGSADFAAQEPVADVAMEAPTANSPYQVELVSGSQALPTYSHNGRFYVLGQAGVRYAIRVTNPTSRRVEAVISVDGLDVIDGETANSQKRGYVVMPGATINIDGFRVSTSHVAAFRFSSVDDSYAGRKGKARNVGVVGVAIFEEQAEQTMIVPDRVAGRDLEDEADDLDYEPAAGRTKSAPNKDKKAADSRSDRAIRRRPAPPSITSGDGASAEAQQDVDVYEPAPREECCGPRTNRPGLGTEYGERRYSAVGFTRFVRANNTTPSAYAELRYNNAAGLAALGITAGPGFDDNELTRRETAEPFPGQRFSQPPQ